MFSYDVNYKRKTRTMEENNLKKVLKTIGRQWIAKKVYDRRTERKRRSENHKEKKSKNYSRTTKSNSGQTWNTTFGREKGKKSWFIIIKQQCVKCSTN